MIPSSGPIIVTGMCTAMRRGDCCLLRWGDVDLEAGFLAVKTSKTGETVDIPILGLLQEELLKARALDPATIDTTEIRPGARVTLEGPKGKKTVTLLGPWDSKPDEGVYSYLSELGKLLLGKTAGEQATVLGDEMTIKKIEVFG